MDLESKFEKIEKLLIKIDSKTHKISGEKIIFFKKNTIGVNFSNHQLTFNNLISWHYVIFHEYSSLNIDFITKKIEAYNLSQEEHSSNLKKLVHAFRTIFQHQMDFDQSISDREKKYFCDNWIERILGKTPPTNEEQWFKCVVKLLEISEDFFNSILNCLIEIEKSEHCEIVIEEWLKLIEVNYQPLDFERVLLKVLENLGLIEYFDSMKLTKKYYDQWKHSLKALPYGFNFEVQAYRIIESTIISQEIIPINGKDIIKIGVSPGPKILEYLKLAKTIFYETPCNKEELLIKVQHKISEKN